MLCTYLPATVKVSALKLNTNQTNLLLQESELVHQLKLGDEEAFRILVEEYKDRVYNTCMGFLHNPRDAEDLTQEVFIKVFESVDTFREDSTIGTWIYRIAVTKCLEVIRKRKRIKRRGFFQALLNTNEEPDESADTTFFQHPGIALEQKEQADILMKAIETLAEQQRIAFTLHKLEDLSYKKIAAIMEVSLPAVESLMHRAKKNLQKELYSYYKNEDHYG